MKEPIKINANVSSGGQPSEAELSQMKASGIGTIINLRRSGEQNQPLDPQAEGDVAKRMGFAYVHNPVDPKNLQPAQAEAVAKAISAAPGLVYIHCAAGGRATTHALLAEATAAGQSADQVLAKAEAIGAPITDEGFKAFVRTIAGDGKK